MSGTIVIIFLCLYQFKNYSFSVIELDALFSLLYCVNIDLIPKSLLAVFTGIVYKCLSIIKEENQFLEKKSLLVRNKGCLYSSV